MAVEAVAEPGAVEGVLNLLRTDDVTTVQALHTLCFPGDDWEEGDAYWILRDELEPKGFCAARKVPLENVVFLVRAGILPSARGAGLQRRMIRTRIQWARKEGCAAAITYTGYNSYDSIVNLLRCGFRFYAPEYAWAGRNYHYFIREFPPPSPPP